MSLAPGTRLGPYEISAQIGVGGMGEVYRATDTKLKRQVAVKVLPEAVASDPDRLARFRREAEVLASLNHPNIAQIHGLEDSDGTHALVMELVEGPTLADHIAQGPIPVVEALPIARQIAEALEAAHEQGIIHRDLKPANIKVRDDGTVKVLDFGLAKAMEPAGAASGSASVSQSPTITTPAMTQMGMILGTAAYMSPEQAKGLPVDRRADVFAFGVVFLEMLAGHQGFHGELVTEVLASVINQEPDYSNVPADLDPRVLSLLRRCLAKAPRDRWQAMGDVRFEIEALIAEPVTAEEPLPVGRTSLSWPLAAGLAMTSAVMAGVAAWVLASAPAPSSPAAIRVKMTLPPGHALAEEWPDFAVSPDGAIAYATGGLLYLKRRDATEPVPLSGTEGANSPFFSPDGRSIGFYGGGLLKTVSTRGGVPLFLCDVGGTAVGGSWGADDTIYFVRSNSSGIYKVPAGGGGDCAAVTTLDRSAGEISHRWPQALPGAVLFTVWTGPGFAENQVDILRLDTGVRSVAVQGGVNGRYVSSGHLVYALKGEQMLMARPFDLAALQPTGPAERLEIPVTGGLEGAVYAVSSSDSGTLVYVEGTPGDRQSRLAWVDRNGDMEPLGETGPYTFPVLSPDGRSIAVTTLGATEAISIYDLTTDRFRPILSSGSSQFPVWDPDGRDLIYRGTREGHRTLYRRPADGSGAEEPVTSTASEDLETAWDVSRNGDLLFTRISPATGADIWVQAVGGAEEPQPFRVTDAWENQPRFSPSGRFVAYASDEFSPGVSEIIIRPFPGREPAQRLRSGSAPVWGSDDRTLFFLDPDEGQLLEATLDYGGGEVRMQNIEVAVREWPGSFRISAVAYDVADGGRILTAVPVQPREASNELVVVYNWHEELNRLVPTP